MIEVLHIIQQLSTGGAARSMLAAAKYSAKLAPVRHRLATLLPAEPGSERLAEDAGMTLVDAPGRDRLLREMERADIVHVTWWNNPQINDLLRWDLPPMRLVLWFLVAGDRPPQVITRDLTEFADVALASSPYTFEHKAIQGFPPEERPARTGMVYGATDFARLADLQPQPHPNFNVGYIGTVHFMKMHPCFVPMSAGIQIPGVRFIVCGSGIVPLLEQQARDLGAADRFEFRGFVEDIRPVIEVFDVYGYPLCEETYASSELNLQEVMFAGVPPVVFPYGGVKRLVEHGRTGLVVDTEAQYREAVEHLYHHPEERARLGKNARDYALRVFGGENAARDLNPVYTRLMERPKRRRRWGVPDGSQLLQRPIALHEFIPSGGRFPGAELFVQSLGNSYDEFALCMLSDDPQELMEAEKRLAAATPVLVQGLLDYREFFPKDGLLRLWAGLGLQGQGQFARALEEFVAALNAGFDHWRLLWYLARTLDELGDAPRAEGLLRTLLERAPDFSPAIDRLRGSKPEPGQAAPRTAPSEDDEKPANPPDVTLVVATKDRAALLHDMLASVPSATGGLHCEIIAVVGNCSDGTLEVLKKHGVTQVFDESAHLGPGRHSWPQLYNFGFSRARGRWGMYASDDIVFEPGSLRNAVSQLDALGQDVAGGIFFYKDVYPEAPEWAERGLCFSIGQHFLMNYGLLRMDFFQQASGLDENFRFYQADADISLKAAAAGKYLVPLPGSFLVHNNKLDRLKEVNQEHGKRDTDYLIGKWRDTLPVHLPYPHRLMVSKDYDLAFELPRRLPRLTPGLKDFWHGLAHLQKNESRAAVDKFLNALDASCNHWIVLWYLARALLEIGDLREGSKVLQIVLTQAPDFKEACDLLARLGSDESGKSAQKAVLTAGQPAVCLPSKQFSHTATGASRPAPSVHLHKTLVLQIQYGGLGDHLFYSPLPRIAKKTGAFDRVFISNLSEYRHPDYRRLVWEMNPHIDGFCDEPGILPDFAEVEPGINIVDKMMLLHGLDDGERFHEPELYLKPEPIEKLSGAIVYDPNFVSYVGDINEGGIGRYMKAKNIHPDYQMKLRDRSHPISQFRATLETPDLEQFCAVLHSCRQIYCLASGTATLAAALGKPATVFYGSGQKPMFHHSRRHTYIRV